MVHRARTETHAGSDLEPCAGDTSGRPSAAAVRQAVLAALDDLQLFFWSSGALLAAAVATALRRRPDRDR